MSRSGILIASVIGVGMFPIAGCRVPPPRPDHPTELELIHEAFQESVQRPLPDFEVAPDAPWWRCVGGKGLELLLARAVAENREIRAAEFRAQALAFRARAADGNRTPELAVSAGASGEQSRMRSTFLGDTRGESSSESYTLGIGLRWEVDLWGRLAHLYDAAEADALVGELDVRVLRLVTIEDVARQWVLHASASEQLGLLQRQTDALQRQISVLADRQRLGEPVLSEVLQLRSLVSKLERDAATIELQRLRAAYRLKELCGVSMHQEIDLTPAIGTDLQWRGALGQPRDVLMNRPDLRAALARLQAADARMHSAFLDSWPRLEFSASAALDAARFTDLFLGELWRAAASLSAPLLDGGRRSALEGEALALRDAAAEDLASALLTTLAELEGDVAAVRYLSDAERASQQASSHALDALNESRSRFLGAGGSALDALIAEERSLQAERDAIEARRDHALAIIRLGVALGHSPDPSPRGSPTP